MTQIDNGYKGGYRAHVHLAYRALEPESEQRNERADIPK